MKKLLAIILVLALTLCACSGEEAGNVPASSTANGASEAGTPSESEASSGESSAASESHSSQTSGDAASESNESSSGSQSGALSSTSSAPETSSGISVSQISPIAPGIGGEAEAMENSYVKRVSTISSDGIIWYHAVNEKVAETDRPVVVLTNMSELNSFIADMDGLYFQSYGENSAGTILKGYDEAFFEENAIILTHLKSNSGSVRYTVTGINISGGVCTMNIKAQMPEVGTADMADWFIFAEVPAESIAGCTAFSVNVGF